MCKKEMRENMEMIYNPDFKVVEFDHFKSEAGLHTFVLSVAEWILSLIHI